MDVTGYWRLTSATRSRLGVDDTLTAAISKTCGKSVEQDGGVPVAVCAETVATNARSATAYCIVPVDPELV